MLAHRFCHANLATTQEGGARSSMPFNAWPHQNEISAKVLTRAPLTLEEVADFLELPASPEKPRWAARALAYVSTFDEPLERMAGLMLVRGWVATTPPARVPTPEGRLRFHAVVTH